jgi:hypothetical protein
MTENSDQERPVLTGKVLERVLSDLLKLIGFRPGAPIYRADARFTIGGLQRALFPVVSDDEAILAFVTVAGEEIRVRVTVIRDFVYTSDEDFAGDLFPRERYESARQWIIEGLLIVPDRDPLAKGSYTLAVAEHYDYPGGQSYKDPTLVPGEPPDAYLKVIAVISCNREGRVESAVVQRVPSPSDEVLRIPPP